MISRRVTTDGTALTIYHKYIAAHVADCLVGAHKIAVLHDDIAIYRYVYGAVTRDYRTPVRVVLLVENHRGRAGNQRVFLENRSPEVRIPIRSGIAGHHGTLGDIGAVAGDSVVTKPGILFHTGVPGRNSIVKNPGFVLAGQICFMLHETAHITRFNLVPHIPQGADAMQERIFFVGDFRNFKLIISHFQTSCYSRHR